MAYQFDPTRPSAATTRQGAVVSGAGPAVLSELAVAEELAAGRLTAVPVADLDLTRTLRAVWPRGHRPAGPARDLLALSRPNRPAHAPRSTHQARP